MRLLLGQKHVLLVSAGACGCIPLKRQASSVGELGARGATRCISVWDLAPV